MKKLRIMCAAHNQVLEVYSSSENEEGIIVDVVPCPQCAAQHSVHPTGLSAAQKEEVRQMIQSALDTGSA